MHETFVIQAKIFQFDKGNPSCFFLRKVCLGIRHRIVQKAGNRKNRYPGMWVEKVVLLRHMGPVHSDTKYP